VFTLAANAAAFCPTQGTSGGLREQAAILVFAFFRLGEEFGFEHGAVSSWVKGSLATRKNYHSV
jgi:hypothetical protein